MASLFEMIMHPWANLKKIQGLDRLPDRRYSRNPRNANPMNNPDPIGRPSGAGGVYKALGLYSQEESRAELYESYREMDYDALIARVLDSFGEEAGQRDSEHNRVVWVEAASSSVRDILLKMFDRIRLDDLAFPVMRSMARDGDVFMHVASARGDGIVALKPYDPWQIARVQDDIGRLISFAPADSRGQPSRVDTHSIPYWRALHFRLPPRDLTKIYGAESSYLWGSRITWRQLQLMLDQVVVQRLLRRPDRLMVLVDTTGMSHDDAFMICKDFERRMHREWNLDPTAGRFESFGASVDGGQDIILPTGPNNNTSFSNFPATSQNDLMRDLDLMYRNLANGIGYPYGFLRGEGRYNPEQSLARQHHPFAGRASRLQRSFMQEIARMCMIDLAFKGLNPMAAENQFSLHMAPPAPLLEMERQEIIQMRMDRMDRALRLAQDAQLDTDKWIPYVLKTYGGFPDDVVKDFFKGSGNQSGAQVDSWNESMASSLDEATKAVERVIPAARKTMNVHSSDLDAAFVDTSLIPIKEGNANSALQNDTDAASRITQDEGTDRVLRKRIEASKARQSVVASLMGSGKLWDNG